MSENESTSEDRTHEPTAKRLQEARERGQLPRSRELNTALIMLSGASALILSGHTLGLMFLEGLRHAFDFSSVTLGSEHGPIQRLIDVVTHLFLPVLPLIFVCFIAAIFGPNILGGLNWSVQSITPDLKRLSPSKGIKKIFSMNNFGETVKSILRIFVVGAIAYAIVYYHQESFQQLSRESPRGSITHALLFLAWTFLGLISALVILAAVDVPFQLWTYRRQLRMTLEELKKEMKESEGNPEVKGKIRRLQQEVSRSRMLEAVPAADAIIVNPTHFAVAISYNPPKIRTPRVVAKGTDLIAQNIRDIAEQHKVPIVSAPSLARVLFRNTNLGQEIPVNTYTAVAQVLGFVYQLKAYRKHGGKPPIMPEIKLNEDDFIKK